MYGRNRRHILQAYKKSGRLLISSRRPSITVMNMIALPHMTEFPMTSKWSGSTFCIATMINSTDWPSGGLFRYSIILPLRSHLEKDRERRWYNSRPLPKPFVSLRRIRISSLDRCSMVLTKERARRSCRTLRWIAQRNSLTPHDLNPSLEIPKSCNTYLLKDPTIPLMAFLQKYNSLSLVSASRW